MLKEESKSVNYPEYPETSISEEFGEIDTPSVYEIPVEYCVKDLLEIFIR